MQRTDATSWVETKGHGIHLSGGQCMAMNESCSVRVVFVPSGTEGRKTTLTEQDDGCKLSNANSLQGIFMQD